MTTALIGRPGDPTTKARVALLTRQTGNGIAAILARNGHDLVECRSWSELDASAAMVTFDLVLCDEEAAAERASDLGCPVLVFGDRQGGEPGGAIALAAIEAGIDALLSLAITLTQRTSRCRELERIVAGIRTGTAMVGQSPAIRRLQGAISRAADCDATVLIEGPPGSGKSLAARMIHCKSRRSNHQLVVLAGDTATADTLAKAVDESRGTTLVIEDVDRLPAPAQAALVRHLKERPAAHQGGAPRLLATTSAHLPEMVARGAFREDLFYRLHALPILVPGLRERTEDIPLLAQAALALSTTSSTRTQPLTQAALSFLESLTWPGNVAQLEATVRRAQLLAAGGPVDREHVATPAPATAGETPAAADKRQDDAGDQAVTEDTVLPFEQEEQRMLSRALRATKGNVRRAAQLLGIGRATLYRKIQQYQLRLQ